MAQSARDAAKGEGQPVDYLLSKSGDKLMVKYPGEFRYGELNVQQALQTPAEQHLVQAQTQPAAAQTVAQQTPQPELAPEPIVRHRA